MNKMLDKRTYQLLQGSTLLDEKLFAKKKNFFYNTSYDILIRGDCGSSKSYLEIFKAIRQKSKLKEPKEPIEQLEHEEKRHRKEKDKDKIHYEKEKEKEHNTDQIPTKPSRNENTISHNGINNNTLNEFNSTSKSHFLVHHRNPISKPSLSPTQAPNPNPSFNHQSNHQSSMMHNTSQKTLFDKRINKSLPKTRNNSSEPFLKSKSMTIMGNTMENHQSFIKCLDAKLSQLDIEINKMNKEEIFKVPVWLNNDLRTKVLSLLKDYFPKQPFRIMKERYNKLYGNEEYIQKIKKLKSRLSLDSVRLNRRYQKGEIAKEDENKYVYLRVANGGALHNRKVVSNKYDTIGKVKILNIPKDFYDDITGFNDRYSIGASNVREMYSMIDQKEQKIMNFAQRYYYSREKKSPLNERLSEITNQFSKVENNGKQIKNKILRLKNFLNDKSPLLSDKIFAYIDDSPKEGNKKSMGTNVKKINEAKG